MLGLKKIPAFELILLIRPHHWVKNFFIFLPAFFAVQINDPVTLGKNFIAFASFSLSASVVYILNDYFDRQEDQKHPKKKDRPLASGKVSVRQGLFLALVCLLLSLGLGLFFLPNRFLFILALYLGNNLAYNLIFRYLAIVDTTSIAGGFVLRLFAGSASADIFLSIWIVIMTFLLTLFLGLAKRRDDLLIQKQTGHAPRKAVEGYNLKFTENAMTMMSGVIVVAYLMYTVSPQVANRPETSSLYISAFWVVLGVLRYMHISFVLQDSGSPTKILLKDCFLQLILVGWIATFWLILYTGL